MKFDLVIGNPPYVKIEIFGNKISQCWNANCGLPRPEQNDLIGLYQTLVDTVSRCAILSIVYRIHDNA